MPSRCKPTHEVRELPIERTFLGDSTLTSVRRTSSSTSSAAFTTCIVQTKLRVPRARGLKWPRSVKGDPPS